MKNSTKKFVGGVVVGFVLGTVVTYVIAAHFIINTFGYVN